MGSEVFCIGVLLEEFCMGIWKVPEGVQKGFVISSGGVLQSLEWFW